MSTGRSAIAVLIGWTNPFCLQRVIRIDGILRVLREGLTYQEPSAAGSHQKPVFLIVRQLRQLGQLRLKSASRLLNHVKAWRGGQFSEAWRWPDSQHTL